MNSPSVQPPMRRSSRSRILLAMCSTVIAAVLFGIFILAYGRVTGFELSPDSLKLRSFSYWQIPVINLQIFPASRARVSTGLEKFLIAEKFIKGPAMGASSRWDVASARGSRLNYIGDAELVRTYLQLEDGDGKHPWVEWSKAHPKLAKTLWPTVVSAIQRQHYIAVPRLLELAKTATDDAQLAIDIDAFLGEAAGWLDLLDAESDPGLTSSNKT